MPDRLKPVGEQPPAEWSDAWEALHWRGRALALDEELALVETEADNLRSELDALPQTVSWRASSGLRTASCHLRRLRSFAKRVDARIARSLPDGDGPIELAGDGGTIPPGVLGALPTALRSRMATVTNLLLAGGANTGDDDGAGLERFVAALGTVPPLTAAWLAWVVATGTYPDDRQLDRALVEVELAGSSLGRWVLGTARRHRRQPGAERELRVLQGAVLVDVTDTASNDVHTGIQRVVRETAERWLAHPETELVSWDEGWDVLVGLAPAAVAQFLGWRNQLREGGRRSARPSGPDAAAVIVPWRCTVLMPELGAEPWRVERFRAVARAGVLARLGLIGHDFVPVVASETVDEGMSTNFANFLALAKRADRLSANSRTTAEAFGAFGAMLASQGKTGPQITPHLLPADIPDVGPDALEATRELLALDSLPMVLAVGSHEPRKNHLGVLLAAERLWRDGLPFHLVFIGGSGWKSERFHELAASLREAGRPVQVVRKVDEDTLFAAYRLAAFTVFPSLAEGFGLPVIESLLSGTPVITSNYGSTAEVAEGGGAVVVDPRDLGALEAAMRRLLTDGHELERLRSEAATRRWKSWDEYATETWAYLVEGS